MIKVIIERQHNHKPEYCLILKVDYYIFKQMQRVKDTENNFDQTAVGILWLLKTDSTTVIKLEAIYFPY